LALLCACRFDDAADATTALAASVNSRGIITTVLAAAQPRRKPSSSDWAYSTASSIDLPCCVQTATILQSRKSKIVGGRAVDELGDDRLALGDLTTPTVLADDKIREMHFAAKSARA
jgi:hypothetical protein